MPDTPYGVMKSTTEEEKNSQELSLGNMNYQLKTVI